MDGFPLNFLMLQKPDNFSKVYENSTQKNFLELSKILEV